MNSGIPTSVEEQLETSTLGGAGLGRSACRRSLRLQRLMICIIRKKSRRAMLDSGTPTKLLSAALTNITKFGWQPKKKSSRRQSVSADNVPGEGFESQKDASRIWRPWTSTVPAIWLDTPGAGSAPRSAASKTADVHHQVGGRRLRRCC